MKYKVVLSVICLFSSLLLMAQTEYSVNLYDSSRERVIPVAVYQPELPDDPPLAMAGDFMETRMPNWERGVENVLFVLNEFRKLKPAMKWTDLTLIGHSNGGDMVMLFAKKHPELIQRAISLDHRRMIMPRCSSPRIYTLRGSDYDADENVIPTEEEQQKYRITVINLDGIRHGDMDDKGTKEQHDIILRHICRFLKD